MVEKSCQEKGFAYTFHNWNDDDKEHTLLDEEKGEHLLDKVREFAQANAAHIHRCLMVYQGHGCKKDGRWRRPGATPTEVKKIFMEASQGSYSNPAKGPAIIVGSCFGGWWLRTCEGVSASSPDETARGDGYGGAMWTWLFQNDVYPTERGSGAPMKRL